MDAGFEKKIFSKKTLAHFVDAIGDRNGDRPCVGFDSSCVVGALTLVESMDVLLHVSELFWPSSPLVSLGLPGLSWKHGV